MLRLVLSRIAKSNQLLSLKRTACSFPRWGYLHHSKASLNYSWKTFYDAVHCKLIALHCPWIWIWIWLLAVLRCSIFKPLNFNLYTTRHRQTAPTKLSIPISIAKRFIKMLKNFTVCVINFRFPACRFLVSNSNCKKTLFPPRDGKYFHVIVRCFCYFATTRSFTQFSDNFPSW